MAEIILIIIGLSLFEVINSIDNAIINADVLATMKAKARRWFLIWGILIAVFLVRGLLPWLIVYFTTGLGLIGSFTATFSNDPHVAEVIEKSAPVLLMGGGIFLVLLFFHWLFLEDKRFYLKHEHFFRKQGIWFYFAASIFLAALAFTVKERDLLLGAITGFTVFFLVDGFKKQAEQAEEHLAHSGSSDVAKILFLEVIDATFSIDGVIGAFAFTMSVPLILLGNGLGAVVVRQLTIGNIDRIKKYIFLKNGAMYSVLVLGGIMMAEAFDYEVSSWVAPLSTMIIVGFFLYKSIRHNRNLPT
jgi:hypothetical protein